jgi:antitoxin component YwqK of YwqJK toxin-antitoxin module
VLNALDSTTVQRLNYVMGKMEGETITYFDGTLIQTEGMMTNNKREGEWKWYHQNGTLETSANYVNGLKEGPQNFYDEYGTLIRTEYYQHGELTDVEIK